MPAAVAIAHDPAGEDIRVNRAFAAILGVPPESNASAAQPQRPFRFLRDGRDVAPEDLPQQRAQRLRRTIEGEELEVLRADGRRFHLYGSVVPLLDDQNRVQGSVAAYLNVTARKEMEEALRRSGRRLSLLVEASPVGILLANLQGDIHYANQAFLRIVGYTALEAAVTPLRWSELTPPEWRHMDQQAEEELLRGGFVTPFEKEYIRKDGSRVPVLLGGCLMDEPYEDREQIVAFVVDLTERKKVETDLRNANVELRRANHDLEEFAYAAAHDLQEPLRMVSLFTQLLERRHKGEFQGSAAEIMQQIIESASRAQTLVSDLLAYTRVIHAHPETPLTVDCNEVLAQVLNDLGVAVAETGATVTFDPLPAVSMSRSHLGQLFQNLIGNALKYAQPGLPPSVHISVRAIESAYLFTVRDNGIGVAREYQDRIFGVFKRLHGQNVPGTGIGLAICRRIVERYGGHLWVESAGEGFGSTFLFTVPT
jgi:PAS domain S-box-containing protein